MEVQQAEPQSSQDAPDSAKRRQIMEGARRVFLADGFDGASMNDIARVAGVSKGTLYVYFDSKEQLFEALIREERHQQAERLCDFSIDDPDIRCVLFNFGRRLIEMMIRPDSMSHLRTVIAASSKFPRLGRAFYEAGPCFGANRLTQYLTRRRDDGLLDIADPDRIAWQFLALCKAETHTALLFRMIDEVDPAAIEATISSAVDVILAAYGSPKLREQALAAIHSGAASPSIAPPLARF
jgi:AcrR family transcriptional regulator